MKGRILIIAGSDSGGGAGIQADIKTVTALNGFAMTAITALTAQNTKGVTAIHDVPQDFIAEQIRVVVEDLGVDAIKTGMLSQPETIETVCQAIETLERPVPLVVDPVMVAKGGASLLAQEAVAAMKTRLLPKATLLTPNVPEAEVLSGIKIETAADMERAAHAIMDLGAQAVLMKGGHFNEGADTVMDTLFYADEAPHQVVGPRIQTRHTHGTGCTMASALACGLGQGLDLVFALERAKSYVVRAIETAPGYGQGHGPLNHAHTVQN